MKPERDEVRCSWSCCQRNAEISTQAGPMCKTHAEEVAAILLERGER